MKVLILFFYILFISVNCFSQIINRDSLTISDTLNISNIYKNVYKTASKDKKIKDDEIKLLKTLRKSLQLSKKQALAIENKFNYSQTNALDQSGRWPLVIQNIGWGAGLYGWGLPYILGVEDGKWFIASELMSFSGSFYLTHKYTKNMNIPHARSQMIRLGSLIGFHYGWSFGKITHQDFDLNSNNKTWATLLMASVPAGIWVGDKLYGKWQPTNGQAWTISLATLLGNMTINNIHNIVSNKPEEPEYIDNSYNTETGTWTDEDSWEETNEYKKYEDNLEKWEINQNILYMATYPISLYLGNRYFGEKNYNFGDALMLYQGYGLGMLYSMMFLDALGNENDNIFLGGLIIGGYSGTEKPKSFMANSALIPSSNSSTVISIGWVKFVITPGISPN